MKKFILLVVIIPFSSVVFAQQPNKDKQNMNIVTNSEPAYPKGDHELYTFVLYNVKYPAEAIKKNIEGEVTLSFDVKPDSTVSNIVLISGVGSGVDEEVKKLVQTLKFIPAKQNGVRVKMNSIYTFPVKAH
jgi:TonB family protein